MASEPPSKKSKLSEPCESSNPTISSDDPGEILDMCFVVLDVFVLKAAIEAVSDSKFNPLQQAVLQAGEKGCEITVYNRDLSHSGGHLFGVLRLNATGLYGYKCRNPFKKLFTVTGLAPILRHADRMTNWHLYIYVKKGSDLLSFRWKNATVPGSRLGPAFDITLQDVTSDCIELSDFPDVKYGLEAMMPLRRFRKIASKVILMLLEGHTPTAKDFDTLVPTVVRTEKKLLLPSS